MSGNPQFVSPLLCGVDGKGLPAGGGVYVLVLQHSGGPMRLRVGALGQVAFAPGYYCYVGSARSGLKARVGRHLRVGGKRTRWHVDYLRRRTRPVAVLVWPGGGVTECRLSLEVSNLAQSSVRGFGAGDCRCASHLHYFPDSPLARLKELSLYPQRPPEVVAIRSL